MKIVDVRCQVCGKAYSVTSINKDYDKIAKNPNYPYHCESCAAIIQAEALQKKYPKVIRPNPGI